MSDELVVEVKCSYSTVAKSSDRLLVAKILSLMMENEVKNPETPEQKLESELRARAERAESEKLSAQYDLGLVRKELEVLKKAVTSNNVAPLRSVES